MEPSANGRDAFLLERGAEIEKALPVFGHGLDAGIGHHAWIVEHAGIMIAEGYQMPLAIIHGGTAGHRCADNIIKTGIGPEVGDRLEMAGIGDELGAGTGPIAEDVRQVAAGSAHENAVLEILVTDGAVGYGQCPSLP